METAKIYRLNLPRAAVNRASPASYSAPQKPRLLDELRHAIRTRHYSPKTEESYVHWIKRFIFFHNKRHPAEMGEKEIAQFLSSLASKLHVSASTQNQALNALIFTAPCCRGKLVSSMASFGQRDRTDCRWF
jgi:hypothetical protein